MIVMSIGGAWELPYFNHLPAVPAQHCINLTAIVYVDYSSKLTKMKKLLLHFNGNDFCAWQQFVINGDSQRNENRN